MKTKIFLLILALGLIVSAFSQKPTLELTFTAENNGQYVSLDSILVENLTQGEDTTLYAPDTILVLDYITSIRNNHTIGENNFSVSQNYPNPFKEKTTVDLYMKEKEHINITILDIIGRQVAQYENTLNPGNHSFDFYSGIKKYYLFTVTGKQTSKTIKMLNANGNSTFRGKCKIVYNKYEDNVIGFKSQKAINNFLFNLGDQLRYIGYAKTVNEVNGSDVLEDAPQTNEIYLFEITEGIPCPGIPTVTYEGQVYNTVLIGDQCWLKENMNYETGNSWCYDNNSANCETYGRLYDWETVFGVCPPGWHLPSDDEWCTLTTYIDPTVNCNVIGWSGTDVGYKIKSTSGWCSNGNGSDAYGFRALPGGYLRYYGNFDGIEKNSYFWSSTELYNTTAWGRSLFYCSDEVYRYDYCKEFGISVRCVKD
jgi:uncharacterized protein (TIGR02145 family)